MTRSRIRFGLSLALLGAALLGACSQQSAEEERRRRVLLTPPDTRAAREEREKKARVFDDEGNLLESEQTVAGLVLPRGLSAPEQSEHQWYLKAEHVRVEVLERYVTAHISAGNISRSADGTLVVFTDVRPKGDDKANLLTLRVVKLTGASDTSALYIQEPVPVQRYLSAREAEAQINARRQHAE